MTMYFKINVLQKQTKAKLTISKSKSNHHLKVYYSNVATITEPNES